MIISNLIKFFSVALKLKKLNFVKNSTRLWKSMSVIFENILESLS
jgi:hypothetical protein